MLANPHKHWVCEMFVYKMSLIFYEYIFIKNSSFELFFFCIKVNHLTLFKL